MVRMKAEIHADVINSTTVITDNLIKLEDGIVQHQKKKIIKKSYTVTLVPS